MELGLGPTIDGFKSAINECGAQQRWERALLLLSKLERRQLQPDERVLGAALKVCGMCTQWGQALQLLDTLEEKQVKITTRHISLAISAIEGTGDWTRALSLLASLGPRQLQATVEAYTWTICTCARASEWGSALQLLEQMIQEAVDPNEITYRQLSVMCRKQGLWQHGLQLLADVKASPLQWDVAVVLGAVSMACVRAQEWQQAASILAEFESQLEPNYYLHLAQISTLAQREQCHGWEAAFVWLAQKDARGEDGMLDEDVVCPVIRACGSEWQKALEWILALQEEGGVVTTTIYDALVRTREAQGDDVLLDQEDEQLGEEDWRFA